MRESDWRRSEHTSAVKIVVSTHTYSHRQRRIGWSYPDVRPSILLRPEEPDLRLRWSADRGGQFTVHSLRLMSAVWLGSSDCVYSLLMWDERLCGWPPWCGGLPSAANEHLRTRGAAVFGAWLLKMRYNSFVARWNFYTVIVIGIVTSILKIWNHGDSRPTNNEVVRVWPFMNTIIFMEWTHSLSN